MPVTEQPEANVEPRPDPVPPSIAAPAAASQKRSPHAANEVEVCGGGWVAVNEEAWSMRTR